MGNDDASIRVVVITTASFAFTPTAAEQLSYMKIRGSARGHYSILS